MSTRQQEEDETTLPEMSESAIAHMQGEDHNYGTAFRERERQLLSALCELKAIRDKYCFERNDAANLRKLLSKQLDNAAAERDALKAENSRLLNDASIWRNRAIGAEEELNGSSRLDPRKGFKR